MRVSFESERRWLRLIQFFALPLIISLIPSQHEVKFYTQQLVEEPKKCCSSTHLVILRIAMKDLRRSWKITYIGARSKADASDFRLMEILLGLWLIFLLWRQNRGFPYLLILGLDSEPETHLMMILGPLPFLF